MMYQNLLKSKEITMSGYSVFIGFILGATVINMVTFQIQPGKLWYLRRLSSVYSLRSCELSVGTPTVHSWFDVTGLVVP